MSWAYWSFVLNFQDPATTYCHSLITVHHDAMWYLILILTIVYWNLFKIVKDSNWSVFNKQYGLFLVFFRRFFFLFLIFFFSFFLFFLLFLFFFFFLLKIFFFYFFIFFLNFFKFYNSFLKKIHPIFLNSIISSDKASDSSLTFYNFQRGYESVLGYSDNSKTLSISGFSSYFNRFFSLFVDKYLDYFLFNHTNILYRYYNETENNSNFFL